VDNRERGAAKDSAVAVTVEATETLVDSAFV
jgi:hypothetical protein